VSQRAKTAKRILIIEDESAVASYLSALLQQESFEITHVPTLDQAKTALPSGFDLILLDLMLPDGTGDELLPILRAAAPDTPILIVTGAPPNDERLVKCLKTGAAGYVPKSGRVEELLRHIRRALKE
jgi:DNA-binding response OmpR family regulator